MSVEAELEGGRIPAWRRLGLRLNSESSVGVLTNGSESHEADAHRRKKRRVEEQATTKGQYAGDDRLQPTGSKVKPGKKVSFTAETKVQDGDSSKTLISDWQSQLDFQTQLLEEHELAKSIIEKEEKESAKVKESVQGGVKERANGKVKSKEVKGKEVKEKGVKGPQQVKTGDKPHAALEYLRQHEAGDGWKFNKNKEVWLVKNAFDLDKIPSNYDMPLSYYLKGLKSTNARDTLTKKAADLLESEPADAMESAKLRQQYHDYAVNRYKRKIEDDFGREDERAGLDLPQLAKRRRAEIVSWAMGVTSDDDSTTETKATNGNGSERVTSKTSRENTTSRSGSERMTSGTGREKATSKTGSAGVKKRKNRTAVVEISSDESDSDDTSESDSSESGDEAGNTKLTKDGAGNEDDEASEDTSSDETSDGSGDDESEGGDADHPLEVDTESSSGKDKQSISVISISSG